MSTVKPQDLGLSILRVLVGIMMFVGHGMGKLSQIGTEAADSFLPVFGLSAQISHFMAACAEGVGSILLIFGIFTRFTALAMALTMFFAAFVAHAENTFYPQWFPSSVPEYKMLMAPFKEYSLLYGSIFISLVFTGAGRYSVDENIKNRLPFFLKFFC